MDRPINKTYCKKGEAMQHTFKVHKHLDIHKHKTQHHLKMISKFTENDVKWCLAKMLNLGSYTWIHSLIKFTLENNSISECDLEDAKDLVFLLPQNFGIKLKIMKKVLTRRWPYLQIKMVWKVFLKLCAC